EQQQHHANQHEPLPGRLGDEEGERDGDHQYDQLLAKRLLAARGGEKAVPGVDGGAQQSFHGRDEGSWDGPEPNLSSSAPKSSAAVTAAQRHRETWLLQVDVQCTSITE